MAKVVNPISQPYFGGAPYGDALEVSGPPVFEFIPDVDTPFLKTDARSISILVHPHHYNFIPNPAFRVDATGWEISGVGTLDESDMWVGQSLRVDGEAVIRYRDKDSNNQSAFVYVGPSQDLDDPEWRYDPSRGSAQWTFSTYFKGKGRARLVMRAYHKSDFDVIKSPPEFQDLTVVANPAALPYDADTPAVQDNNGQVWQLRQEPYYENLGRPYKVANPASLTNQPSQYVLDNSNNLWSATTPKPSAPPLYVNLGATTVMVVDEENDPETRAPGPQYLRTDHADPNQDNYVWSRINTPYYEPTGRTSAFGEVIGKWVDINTTDWDRQYIQTYSQWANDEQVAGVEGAGEGGGSGANFYLVDWIDARIEIEDAEDLLVSAVMLDPTEYPIASYFDGDMTEDPHLDDFMWSGTVNNSISYYYYDRVSRVRWLTENLRYLVPVNRTFQIYFGSYDQPYIAPITTITSKAFTI